MCLRKVNKYTVLYIFDIQGQLALLLNFALLATSVRLRIAWNLEL